MSDFWAYALAACAAAVLIWAGWFRRVDADPGTLVACAATHMQLARGIPVDSPEGRAVRDRMLDDAEQFVARAESAVPGHPLVLLARGDLLALRGQSEAAIAKYGDVLAHEDCTADMRPPIRLRRAELALEVGDASTAVAEASAVRASGSSRFETLALRLEIRGLVAAGERDRALALGESVAAGDDIDASLAVGETFESLGEQEAATAAYRGTSVTRPVADYYVARLKLGSGEIDTARVLLDRAIESSGPSVSPLLERDRKRWEEHLGAERVSAMLGSPSASPK